MKFVAYYRVSTSKQGRSGLGPEGQRARVEAYVKDGQIVGEYVEVESGDARHWAAEFSRQ